MPRLTISLSTNLHNRLSSLASTQDDSLSNVINQLIQVGMQHINEERKPENYLLEQHCQQLIIQMNALIKNISVEVLKFNQDDFEKLKQLAIAKYNELTVL
jgi:uncharacterized protein YicC (UPF0701 family)